MGIIGHILGFGLKNLAIFVLKYSIFKETHWYRWLYLLIQICCFIIYTWLMSIIRPKFCFVIENLEKNASLLIDKTKEKIDGITPIAISSRDINFASVKGRLGSSTESTVSDNDKKVLYESDLFSNLMEIAEEESKSIDEINDAHQQETREEIMEQFYDFTQEIDGDAWLISIGFMWVDIIFLLYQHKYLSLNREEIDESEVVIEDFDWKNAPFYAGVFISIYIFWIIYSWLCSYFQVHRDRCILVEYGEILAIKHKESIENDFEDIEEEQNELIPALSREQGENRSLSKHNKCFRFFIKFSLTHFTSETVFMFMDGTCGWCFGWSYVGIMLNLKFHEMEHNILYLYLIANIAALLVTIVFLFRMWNFRRELKKWMRDTIKNADGVSESEKTIHLSHIDLAKQQHLDDDVDEELRRKYFNFPNMTYTNHAKLFHLLHANWFWRRALAIAYAVPLEEVFDRSMEYWLEHVNEANSILISIGMAVILTVILGLAGLWLVDIKQSRKSQDVMISKFLQGKPVKLHDLIKKH